MVAPRQRTRAGGGKKPAARTVTIDVPVGVDPVWLVNILTTEAKQLAAAGTIAAAVQDAAEPPSANSMAAIAQHERRWRDLADEYGLYTAAEVATLVGSAARNRAEYASTRFRNNQLLAVQRAGRLLFPGYQFDPVARQIWPGMDRLVHVFHDAGWAQSSAAIWLTGPNGYLGGAKPADVLDTRMDDVIDAAQNAAARR